MEEYFKNLINRLRRYSTDLDKIELFVDRSWLYQDDKNNNHEYIFLRDQRLILTLNGAVTEGKWELLPNGKLLINRVHDRILLENLFIDNALMVLKKSGSGDIPFILYDPLLIPDGDVVKYLNTVEGKKNIEEVSAGVVFITKDGYATCRTLFPGCRVTSHDGSIPTGNFQMMDKSEESYVVVTNGI
jgi:hypothetical protein